MRSSSVASAVYLLAVLAFLFSIQMYGADVHASTTDSSRPSVPLNATRKLPSDLEVGGDLAELPKGATRYVTLDSLLALPLVTYTVTDDPNFSGPTKISGIALEDLAPLLGADPSADLVAAICDDKYRAAYPRAYLKEHHPLLVLLVNGEPSSRWPKDPGTHRYDMGPYMISHPKFTSGFKILSHSDEAQIPWGSCGSSSATRRPYLAPLLRVGRTPTMFPCRQVTKSRSRIALAATTQAERVNKNRDVPGSCWAHSRRPRPHIFRLTCAIRKRKMPRRKCLEIPATMTRRSGHCGTILQHLFRRKNDDSARRKDVAGLCSGVLLRVRRVQ
jgi:hypothetical protein